MIFSIENSGSSCIIWTYRKRADALVTPVDKTSDQDKRTTIDKSVQVQLTKIDKTQYNKVKNKGKLKYLIEISRKEKTEMKTGVKKIFKRNQNLQIKVSYQKIKTHLVDYENRVPNFIRK